MSYLDTGLWFAGILGEAIAIAFLLYRRIFRNLPVFSLFLVWTIVSDAAMMILSRQFAARDPHFYTRIYMVEISLDFCMQFAVLVELAWSVLRPIRAALPRRTILVISALLLLVGSVLWPIAGKLTLPGPTHQWHNLMQLQQASSMLRVLFVLVLAGFSQLLAIGWRDRELQVATGLGFYSLISLGAAILHTHHLGVDTYHRVDQIVAGSYFCSLLYWLFSFAQKEAPRQEFTPKMESFLLAVSGAARSNRIALEELRKSTK
ncbi:hypothetical protein DYQ86_21810 [Acidobacteria bacterium AB60]|nr:hypothetical protein DYQ86_21810 [Acidobacteria bacterium AB60]